jgi:hypothetical protein
VKLFISWSGATSRHVAEALRIWLPNVIQEVKPWLSAADITPGVRWPLEIGRELEQSHFGVLCLTPDNLAAPWILFEAGALGKRLDTGRVVPYLFRVGRELVTGPLSQFQSVEATREGTRGLVSAVFGAVPEPALSPERLARAFDKWWPDLEQELERIPASAPVDAAPARSEQDLLAEVLNVVRGLQRDAARQISPEASSAPEGPRTETSDRLVALSSLRRRIMNQAQRAGVSSMAAQRDVRERARQEYGAEYHELPAHLLNKMIEEVVWVLANDERPARMQAGSGTGPADVEPDATARG